MQMKKDGEISGSLVLEMSKLKQAQKIMMEMIIIFIASQVSLRNGSTLESTKLQQ
jgi:hypothetical protein